MSLYNRINKFFSAAPCVQISHVFTVAHVWLTCGSRVAHVRLTCGSRVAHVRLTCGSRLHWQNPLVHTQFLDAPWRRPIWAAKNWTCHFLPSNNPGTQGARTHKTLNKLNSVPFPDSPGRLGGLGLVVGANPPACTKRGCVNSACRWESRKAKHATIRTDMHFLRTMRD